MTDNHVKRMGVSALLLLCGTTAGVLLCEIIVRACIPQRLESVRPIYEADSALVYKLKSNYRAVYSQPEFEVFEATNSAGLRDREIGPKPPGGLRILGLGDSFSYSNSVNLEETYFKQLEARLRSTHTGPVEVINAAVPAYSTIQELGFLKIHGAELRPDIVLLGFYVGNDFQDSYELYDTLGRPTVDVVDGVLHLNERFPFDRYEKQERFLRTGTLSIRSFLASHSQFYVFLRERFSEFLWRLGLRNNPPPPDFCARDFSPAMDKGWELVQRLLLEMDSLSARSGTRLIVTALPTQYQVHEELWKHHFATFGLDPAEYDLNKPQQLLAQFCGDHHIEYIDVLPTLRNVAREKPLFYPIASYMNPEGHRVTAEVIFTYLMDGGTEPKLVHTNSR